MSIVCEYTPVASTSTIRTEKDSGRAPASPATSPSTKRSLHKKLSVRRKHARPIPNSYWATPYLVACEFPYCPLTPAQTRQHTKQKLDALLLAGVQTFIDLTEPHELFPYSPHLASRCALLGVDPKSVEYHNFPIRDRSLPDRLELVREILAVLKDNEQRGRVCAVHCRGGIGRTGLVVGCWLVECGLAKDGDDALRMIADQWRQVEKCKRFPCSPETGPQFEFVQTFLRTAGPPDLVGALGVWRSGGVAGGDALRRYEHGEWRSGFSYQT